MCDSFWLRMFVLAGCAICHHAQAPCAVPTLVSPAQNEISEASPRFEWTPVSDAQHYLVWLESRVPEGRVLLAEEFQTSATYLASPRPLATGKAVVRIRVTAVCKDATQAVLSARFRIDEDRACRLKDAPVVEPDNGQVRWETLQIAQHYEIRVHAAADGKPVFTHDSTGGATKIARLEPGMWLVAVQPICRGLRGVNSWVAVDTH